MIKKFEIKDILDAVDSISNIERKKGKTTEIENNLTNKDNILSLNNQAKSDKSDILVLDRMIE